MNCGACGSTCPGYLSPASNVTCQGGATCTFSCMGENYDVDRNAANGCEVTDSPTGNHTQVTATAAGSFPCTDANSNPNLVGRIASDARAHESPAVAGWSPTTGAAPDWFAIYADGGASCTHDVALTLQVTGSSQPGCYRLTVVTDKGSFTAQTNNGGTASVTQGSGAYSDATTIQVGVEKTCATTLTENVTYTVTGHL